MADSFLDISAVGNEYDAYADTPTTWAKPQDGNGRAGPGHAAAVAIATIDVAGCSASGTGTIGVLGVTVSSTLNASGSALATAIVTAINASSTATSASVSQALLSLNRLVFARVNPGVNTQVQIMMRIAGVDWNGLSPTQANISPAATIGAFSGGADGPMAYLFNTANAFGKAALAYGAFVANTAGATTLTGSIIKTRTKRSGANLAVAYTFAGQITVATAAARTFVFDDGTDWTGDDGSLTVTLTATAVNSNVVFGGNSLTLVALKKYGLKVLGAPNGSGYIFNFCAAYSPVSCENVYAEVLNTYTNSGLRVHASDYDRVTSYHGCYFKSRVATSMMRCGYYGSWGTWVDCDFEWVGAGGNIASAMTADQSFSNVPMQYRFTNCRFVVDGGAYSVSYIMQAAYTGGNLNMWVEDCVGVTNLSMGLSASSSQAMGSTFNWRDAASGSFRHETCAYTVEWVSTNASAYPTRSAVSPFGVAMGMRMSWESARLAAMSSRATSYQVTTLATVYRGASGSKVLNIELLVPSADIPTRDQVYAHIFYTDTGGIPRMQTTQLPRTSNVALSAGAGTGNWTLNGVAGVSSRKLSVTTTHAVKSGTAVSAKIFYGGDAPDGAYSIYLTPEIEFA